MTKQELINLFQIGTSVSTSDKFHIHTASGELLEVSFELLLAYIRRGVITVTINSQGFVYVNGENTGYQIGSSDTLTDEERTALDNLVNQQNPLTISISGNGGTLEVGTSVTPTATITVKRGSTDVTSSATLTASSGTLNGASFSDSAITAAKTYTFTATYNSKTATATLSYAFSNYRYRGAIDSVPADDAAILSAIQGVSKELSETATLGTTALSASKYYIFAVKGSVSLVIREATTNGIVDAAKSGTITVPRVNGSGSDTYSYIVVPASGSNWNFKITNS